ncbi:MAG: hypothetical protein V1772_11085 [Chloroflexota bacterium]
MTQDAWTPDVAVRYPLITDLHLSPDGARVAYVVRGPVMTDDESKFVYHLYRAETATGAMVRLTYGQAANTMPRWSPDGRYLAFLSDRGGKANLYVLRAAGGEAWALTALDEAVQSFAWSPDGRALAFTAPAAKSEEKKKAEKAKNDPILWHEDHVYSHLWAVPFVDDDAERLQPRRLSAERQHIIALDWAPDSTALAYTYQPTPLQDDWPQTT